MQREKPLPLRRLQPHHCKQTQPGHGDQRIQKLKRLQCQFPFHEDWQSRHRVVEVMALAVPLHYVRAFLVVDVLDVVAGVWGDAFAVQPGAVGAADGVLGKGTEVREWEGFGGDSWTVMEDAAAGGIGEHGVAESVDEVGCCGGFA